MSYHGFGLNFSPSALDIETDRAVAPTGTQQMYTFFQPIQDQESTSARVVATDVDAPSTTTRTSAPPTSVNMSDSMRLPVTRDRVAATVDMREPVTRYEPVTTTPSSSRIGVDIGGRRPGGPLGPLGPSPLDTGGGGGGESEAGGDCMDPSYPVQVFDGAGVLIGCCPPNTVYPGSGEGCTATCPAGTVVNLTQHRCVPGAGADAAGDGSMMLIGVAALAALFLLK